VTRRLFGTLCGLVFLVNLGRTAFAPLLEPLRTSFGADPAALGLVTTAVWFGTAAARIPTGYLMTRVARVRVVLGAGTLLVTGATAAALAPTLSALGAAAFVIGIASGGYFVAAVPLVGDLFPDRVGGAVGVHGTASQLAAVAAPGVVVGTLAVTDWRGVFWLLAVAACLATLVFVAVGRRTTLPAAAAPDREFRGVLVHWRVLLAAVAVVAAAGFAWQGVFNFYVTYLVVEKGFGRGAANAALTVLFAAGIPAFALSGRLADRLPVVPYLIAHVAGFALALVALTVTDGVASVVALSLLVGYLIHGLFPAVDTYVLGALPDTNRASAYALFSGVALGLEAGGSGAVGALTARGYDFGVVFRTFGLALLPFVAVLAALYLAGRFPAGEDVTRTDG
jgi:predicted MFS family arabinose efflux permease